MEPTSKRRAEGSSSRHSREEKEALKTALTSVGMDGPTISKLLSSAKLGSIVVPLLARGTAVDESNDLWVVKLPQFVRWFDKEFPDGLLRWDPEFEDTTTGMSHPVIRVSFNYQEDDQGDHWLYRPTTLEEESYHRKLRELRVSNGEKFDVRSLLRGR